VKMAVFSVVAPYRLYKFTNVSDELTHRPDDGGSMDL
jgi:hypothetical protein